MILSTITLHLMSNWWRDVRDGKKRVEYRANTPYWRKRLEGKDYQCARIMLGYDAGMTLVFEVVKIELTREKNDLNLPECWAVRLGKKIENYRVGANGQIEVSDEH